MYSDPVILKYSGCMRSIMHLNRFMNPFACILTISLELFLTKLWLLKTIKVSASLHSCLFVRYSDLPLHTEIVRVYDVLVLEPISQKRTQSF